MGVICWIVDYQINIHIWANTDAVITGGSGKVERYSQPVKSVSSVFAVITRFPTSFAIRILRPFKKSRRDIYLERVIPCQITQNNRKCKPDRLGF